MILAYVKMLKKKLTSTFLKWDFRKNFDIVLRIQRTYLLLNQTAADLMYIDCLQCILNSGCKDNCSISHVRNYGQNLQPIDLGISQFSNILKMFMFLQNGRSFPEWLSSLTCKLQMKIVNNCHLPKMCLAKENCIIVSDKQVLDRW